jgi:hypothetical protein
MTPDGTSKAPQIVQFVERTACPCCAGTAARSLWSGRFSDPDVAGYMAQFHYNADLVAELGDQRFDLLRCDACGMTYHRLVVADASVPKVYGSWTDAGQVARFEAAHTRKRSDPFEASVLRVKLVLRLRHLVQQRIPDAAPIRLMDFGCGDGEVLGAARALGMQAIGIDISASRADAARVSGGLVYPDLAAFDDLGGGTVHAVARCWSMSPIRSGCCNRSQSACCPGGGCSWRCRIVPGFRCRAVLTNFTTCSRWSI